MECHAHSASQNNIWQHLEVEEESKIWTFACCLATHHVSRDGGLWGSYAQTLAQDAHPVGQPGAVPQQHPVTQTAQLQVILFLNPVLWVGVCLY